MRVFLTGVSGYLGNVLARHLAQVQEVEKITGIDIAEPAAHLPSKVTFVRMDIRSPYLVKAMAGHDVIVHAAFVVLWQASMPKEVRDDINLNGIRNVAQAAVSGKVRRFIHASSVAAYDPKGLKGATAVKEDLPIGMGDSRFYYANGKALAERILTEIVGSSGMTLTILRPGYIIGPLNTAMVAFLRKGAVRYWGCNPRLQYVHEDDVASAFVRAVTTEMPGAYNVVPDDWLRWSEVLQIVGRGSATAVPVWVARLYAAIAWRFFGSRGHFAWIDAMLSDFTASNAALKARGWKPRHGSAEALQAALR